ncbi:MAG: hypothetical protein HYY58_00700 [Candidatus Omnitrophica bacterium]|nr:hypothetical protein [Candidatus Omnitrophota bacterium]
MSYGTGVLLLSAIGGYWVLERAAAHKGHLKRVGQWLGAAIIVISLVGVACRVWCAATYPTGVAGKRGFCPFPRQSSAAPSVTP